MSKKVKGQKIEDVRTLKSIYDNDCVSCIIDGEFYKIHSKEILKMVNDFVFTKNKKKVHTYLEIDEEATLKMREKTDA